MDIEKLALEYLNQPIIAEAKIKPYKNLKTRKALVNAYEKMREKYLKVKDSVDDLRNQGNALQKKFDTQKETMDSIRSEMLSIRNQINKMDGLEEEEKEELAAKSEPEEIEAAPEEDQNPYYT